VVFIGDIGFFVVFVDGKSWWVCGGLCGKRGLLTVTFRGAENRTPFSTLFSVG
jgi:hypothetical protein